MTTPEEFREFGRAMIDYVADYLENIRDRPVLPKVKPGYLQHLVPKEAPDEPEKWQVRTCNCNYHCNASDLIYSSLRQVQFNIEAFVIAFFIIVGCDGRY